jgi:hypothetical protein
MSLAVVTRLKTSGLSLIMSLMMMPPTPHPTSPHLTSPHFQFSEPNVLKIQHTLEFFLAIDTQEERRLLLSSALTYSALLTSWDTTFAALWVDDCETLSKPWITMKTIPRH